jgi:tripartite ATP-independent transporter DctM subunit
MFILMAFFSASGGLAESLYAAASNWLSHIRGGLAIATVFACMIFGAMSGTSVACASVMATIALPNMRRLGYSEVLSAGAVGVGSVLDILIPPSVMFIVYGIATETSIGKLLIAGVIPGIVLGLLIIICVVIWVYVRPQDAPQTQRVSWAVRWASLLPIWPSISLIIIVLGLLYTGIVTPTEVGAIGAFMAAVVGVVGGHLRWDGVVAALKMTARTTAMIFMIIIGATIFAYYMALSQVPQAVIIAVQEMNLNPYVVIAGIAIGYFVISMFMDELPLMLLTLQITFPLVKSLGFDPVWFGVFNMMLVAMGLIFPPVGLIAFVVSATAKIDLVKVYTGTSILMIAIIATTILLVIFPQIALWLPSTMR